MAILDRLGNAYAPTKQAQATQGMSAIRNSSALKQAEDIPWLALSWNVNPNLITGTEYMGNWLELKNALVDPKAASCMDIRCSVITSMPWQIKGRTGTPQAAVDLVRRALERLELIEPLEQMVHASFYGISPMEVTWSMVKGELLPDKLESFDPWFLSFRSDRTPLVNGKQLPMGKLILHKHGGEWRNPWGLGRGRTVPRWTRVKAAVALATYRDYPNFAHDKIRFSYPDDAEGADQDRYIQIAQNVISGPAMVVPQGMEATPIRLESKFEVGGKLIEAADAQIATAVLGTTLTTSEGQHGGIGSGGAAKAHSDTGNEQKSSDALRVQGTLNRSLIPWIVALNLGPDVIPPMIIFDHEIATELKDLILCMQGLGNMGLTASMTWARQVFGIPAPVDDLDALIMQVQQPVTPGEANAMSDRTPGQGSGKVPGRHKAVPHVHLADAPVQPGDAYGLIDAWATGYRARAAATAGHALQALQDAGDFDQAMEGILAAGRDFPTSAAEWMVSGLRASRALGAYLVNQEVHLGDQAWSDFAQTPDLALRWLSAKIPTLAKDIQGLGDADLRSRAFWVAGVDQLSLLQDLQQGMVDALRSGTPFESFQALWAPKLEAAGNNPGRLQSAFQTNLDGAYGAARFASLQSSPAVGDLVYVTAGDEKVRPEHRILDGVTRPKDDPFWDTHVPPLGFNCRCTVKAADKGSKVTPANDPRIDTPPTTGFGTGGRDFQSYLENLGASAGNLPDLVAPAAQTPFHWLDALTPAAPAPFKVPAAPESWDSLVQDPTGRAIAYLGDQAEVAGALEAPAEIWLQPMVSTDGRQALQLSYLQPMQGGQFLVVRASDGVVPTDEHGFLTDAPETFRRGVRLK
jgi:SPP1 gp7 family putative phage head morphogenesis protein